MTEKVLGLKEKDIKKLCKLSASGDSYRGWWGHDTDIGDLPKKVLEFCNIPVVPLEKHEKLRKGKNFQLGRAEGWKRKCGEKVRRIAEVENELKESRKHLDSVIKMADEESKKSISLEELVKEVEQIEMAGSWQSFKAFAEKYKARGECE